MEIIDHLEPFLQQDVEFKLGNKVLKRGTIKLINIKQHFIKFTMDIEGELKMYELVYPYAISSIPGSTTFSYKLSNFTGSINDQFFKLKTISKQNASSMYDSEVTICSKGTNLK